MKPINKPIKIKNAHLTSLWQTCKPVTLLIKHLQMGDLNKWVEKHYKWSLCMLQGMLNQECLIYMSPIKYLAAFPSHIHYLLLNTCRSKGLIGTNRQPRNKMQCFPHIDFTHAVRPGTVTAAKYILWPIFAFYTFILFFVCPREQRRPQSLYWWSVCPHSVPPIYCQSHTLCRETVCYHVPPLNALVVMWPI